MEVHPPHHLLFNLVAISPHPHHLAARRLEVQAQPSQVWHKIQTLSMCLATRFICQTRKIFCRRVHRDDTLTQCFYIDYRLLACFLIHDCCFSFCQIPLSSNLSFLFSFASSKLLYISPYMVFLGVLRCRTVSLLSGLRELQLRIVPIQ